MRVTCVSIAAALILGALFGVAGRSAGARQCLYTKGYWTTHGETWPLQALLLGQASYSRSELIAILQSSAKKDASIILAGQLIAARLNVAGGSNPAPVAASLTRADTLLASFQSRLPYSIAPNTPLGADMTATARILEDYNAGRLPGSCGPANRAPIADAGDDRPVSVDAVVMMDGSRSTDPDANALTFKWSFVSKAPESVAALDDSAAVTPTFVADQPGTYELQLIVNDGTVDSAPDTVRISTVNSQPVARAGSDQTLAVTNLAQLDGRGSTDPDGDALTFEWTLVARPGDSTASLSDPASADPSFLIDKKGDYTFQLIVSDGALLSPADMVTISTINSVPEARAGPDVTAIAGDTIRFDGSSSTDVDGDPLTFRWSLVTKPEGSLAAFPDATVVAPQFVIDVPGTYVAQLVVNDGTADSLPDNVMVSRGNSRPVAHAGGDQTLFQGSSVQLNGSDSTDIDGDVLSFRWSLTTRPAGSVASLSDPSLVNPTFIVDIPGTYVAQLVVNDGVLDSDADTVVVTTGIQNAPPAANAGTDQTVLPGQTVQLNGSGSSDPEGTPLTFKWALVSRPIGSTATLSDTTIVDPVFVADRAGVYVAQLIVNDGTVDSAPESVTISTEISVPNAVAGPDQAVATTATVQLDGTASSDADGAPLVFFWSLLSRPVGSDAGLSDGSLVNPTFVADRAGTYVAQLIVGDGTLVSAPDTVMITVQDGANLRRRVRGRCAVGSGRRRANRRLHPGGQRRTGRHDRRRRTIRDSGRVLDCQSEHHAGEL